MGLRGRTACRAVAEGLAVARHVWHRADHRVVGEVSDVIHGVELDAGTSYSRRDAGHREQSRAAVPSADSRRSDSCRLTLFGKILASLLVYRIVRARVKPTGWGTLPARRRVVRAGRSVPPSLEYRSVTGVPVARLRRTVEINVPALSNA